MSLQVRWADSSDLALTQSSICIQLWIGSLALLTLAGLSLMCPGVTPLSALLQRKALAALYVSSSHRLAWPHSHDRELGEKAEMHKGLLKPLFAASLPTSYRPMKTHEAQIQMMG